MALDHYHSQVLRCWNLFNWKLNLPILQKNLKIKLNLPLSHKFHIEVLFKHFISTVVYDFLTNLLYYHGNDKDDNVYFHYSGGFLILLLLSLMIMMGVLNDFLRFGNTVTLFISVLQTFLICSFFLPFSHQRLQQGSDHVLQSHGLTISFIF